MLIRSVISLLLVLLPMPIEARAEAQRAYPTSNPSSDACSMLEGLDCECPLCEAVEHCVCDMGSDDRPLQQRPLPIAPAPSNPLLALPTLESGSILIPINIEPARPSSTATTRIASPPSVAVFLSIVCVWTT